MNIKELRERWMKLYMNFMMLMSHNPRAKELLEQFKNRCAEFNEVSMTFFDIMEGA